MRCLAVSAMVEPTNCMGDEIAYVRPRPMVTPMESQNGPKRAVRGPPYQVATVSAAFQGAAAVIAPAVRVNVRLEIMHT